MKTALAILAAVVLATAAVTYYVVTDHVNDEALAQDAKLTRLEERLTAALVRGAVAESISTVRAREIDTLRVNAAALIAAGQRPGPLPPRPLQAAPDTCAPWVGRLAAEVADLERRNGQLLAGAQTAQAAEQKATARADARGAAHRETLAELAHVRDSLADRPAPIVLRPAKDRLRLLVDAHATLEGAQLLAGVRRGPLYGGVRQVVDWGETRTPASRAIVVGMRLEF